MFHNARPLDPTDPLESAISAQLPGEGVLIWRRELGDSSRSAAFAMLIAGHGGPTLVLASAWYAYKDQVQVRVSEGHLVSDVCRRFLPTSRAADGQEALPVAEAFTMRYPHEAAFSAAGGSPMSSIWRYASGTYSAFVARASEPVQRLVFGAVVDGEAKIDIDMTFPDFLQSVDDEFGLAAPSP